MTVNKILISIILAAFVVGVLAMPAPLPNESALQYIMSEPPLWSIEMLSAAIISFSLVALFLANLPDDR